MMSSPSAKNVHRTRRLVLILAAGLACGLPAAARSPATSPPVPGAVSAQGPWTTSTADALGPPGGGDPDDGAAGAAAARAARCAQDTLDGLTLPERAGQVLIVGVAAGNASSASAVVRAYRVGGVFLRGRSRAPASAVTRQVTALQRSASSSGTVPLHVATDQEGGKVQTLSGTGFAAVPSALVQGRWSPQALADRTRAWAAQLRAAGVTLNFAPVADTVAEGSADRNPPIGAHDRQYGSDPYDVASDVVTVVTAAQSVGLLTTVKHFPGLGRVAANTDLSAAAVDRVTDTDDPHLQPFAAAIDAGTAAVMMSLARYPRLDAAHIAAFSPPIIELLRTRLRFDGLIVSDDLGEAVAVQGSPLGGRAVTFIAAGGDLALSVRPADARPMRDALVTAAQGSSSFRQRLDRAALHVLRSKARAGLLHCDEPTRSAARPTP